MSPRKPDPRAAEPGDPTREPLGPFDTLKVDLDELTQLDEIVHQRTVTLDKGWVASILAETDAIVDADGRVELELSLQTDRTLLVRGAIDLRFSVPCARCLAPAQVDVGAETDAICVTFVPADRLRTWAEFTGKPEDEDEIEPLDPAELDEIGYQGSTVDLRKFIGEQILLAYPMRILCERGEACLGLCMRCGGDLNKLVAASGAAPGMVPERCPQCQARLDGIDDEAPDSPWKRALAKVDKPEN